MATNLKPKSKLGILLCLLPILFVFTQILIEVRADFSQRDYHVISDRIVMDELNREWAGTTVSNTKYNRTARTFNINFIIYKDLNPTRFMARAQAYRFTDNVYKLFAPIKLLLNICDVLTRNQFGLGDWRNKYGNLTDCPIKKGVYVIHDWVPDEEKLPPYIPEGKYRLKVEILSDTTSIGALSVYGSIVKRKKF